MMRGRSLFRPRARAAFTPSRTRCADDVSLHLGERGLDLHEGPARRRGGVHGRVEGAESDTALVELVDEGDELAGAAPDTVEVEDDEDIALARAIQARRQVGTIGRGAAGVILEHALAAGGVQSVELSVEDLADFGGGDAGVADEAHGVCGPEKPFGLTPFRKKKG